MVEHTPTHRRTRPATHRRLAQPPAGTPEWRTERWKRRVEAEARGRLKKEIREVGAR